jgi:hypothetical protein
VDTLIITGTAATRAEAIRWALDRIREWPAYQRLRELRGEADKLRHEFCDNAGHRRKTETGQLGLITRA